MNPQTQQVYRLISRDGGITRLVAQHYGISNLTARIADLRIKHNIDVRCQRKVDAFGRKYGYWYVFNFPG